MIGNQMRSFFFQHVYLYSFLYDKIVDFKYFYHNLFHDIKFQFLLKNIYSNRIIFLLIVMLLEKFTSNNFFFVLNKKILRNRFIKVGGIFQVFDQKVYNYLCLLFLFSLPKLSFSEHSEHDIFYYDTNNKIYDSLFFVLNKILFLNYFFHTDDYEKYDYLFEHSVFRIKIKIGTYLKFFLINRDLMRLSGANII